jgi:hypothetical protein
MIQVIYQFLKLLKIRRSLLPRWSAWSFDYCAETCFDIDVRIQLAAPRDSLILVSPAALNQLGNL